MITSQYHTWSHILPQLQEVPGTYFVIRFDCGSAADVVHGHFNMRVQHAIHYATQGQGLLIIRYSPLSNTSFESNLIFVLSPFFPGICIYAFYGTRHSNLNTSCTQLVAETDSSETEFPGINEDNKENDPLLPC